MQIYDLATVTVIVVTAVATSLLEAIAVGLVLSLVQTATRLAGVSVVSNGSPKFSTIERPFRQRQALELHGDAIYVLTLRGYLFFGSASEILDAVHLRLSSQGLQQGPQLRFLIVDVAQCFPSRTCA